MKLALLALALVIPAAAHARFTTDLPYQCTAKEKGRAPTFDGKSSSREDWARSSALEACRKAAANPARCYVVSCADNSEPSDPTPTDPTPTDPGRCSDSNQCSGFDICVNGTCIDKHSSDNRCGGSFDCGWPTQCLNGKCLGSSDPQCSSNSDCSGFSICVDQKCVDNNGSDNRCNNDTDCGFPSHCNNGQCSN